MMEVADIQLVVEQMIADGQRLFVGLLICIVIILGIVVLIIFKNDSARWKGSESRKRLVSNQDEGDKDNSEMLRYYEKFKDDTGPE